MSKTVKHIVQRQDKKAAKDIKLAIGKRYENKRARFDYDISEDFEAGLVLSGPEVKSFRAGKVSLNGAFVRPLAIGTSGHPELWLVNSSFTNANEPDRTRKVLMHRKEIDRLIGRITEKGFTLVPMALYMNRGNVKLSIGLGKGKKQFEKRETIKKRDVEMDIRRSL